MIIESCRHREEDTLETNHIKPDIAAPGYQLPCALPSNRYGKANGSGAAAAFAGGAMAIILEWSVSRGNYTSITGNDISRLLMRGARHNPDIIYPNNTWGYGELDVNRVFEQIASL
ncbi:MAG: S8 family serine peptidase [Enterocloster sp.]